MNITVDELKQYFNYDPITGYVYWIKKSCKTTMINSRAGSTNKKGYRVIKLFKKEYLEHRLIWALYYGKFPTMHIDHINHKRDDNRICNLREVSIADNARNRTRKDSRLDEVGIWWCKRRKRYIAEITFNGKKVYQKSFKDIDEAIQQRKAKSLELGFHENHGE
ncbi:HNH endonuclease signature motif containing protein [Moraxella lincolnii]|uniref:HNH endonuclease signature motif containing protein n=1 Tax=Lwoffella lincolnii TaxID=90241 RepID=UPI0039840EC5